MQVLKGEVFRWITMVGFGISGHQLAFLTNTTGECKNFMTPYLACIKKVKGVNEDQCRELAKAYLSCRMDRWVAASASLGAEHPRCRTIWLINACPEISWQRMK
jgi:hypothetical protein